MMARVFVSVFIGFLAVSQVLSNDVFDKMKSDISEAERWMDSESAAAKTSYKGAVGELRSVKNDVLQKVFRLKGLYDRALDVVESSPPECQKDIKQNLMILKAGGMGNFLTCSKLLEAGRDIAEIGFTTFDLVEDVIDIGRDATLGFADCFDSFLPWRIMECWYDRITTTYDDIKKTISDVHNFASSIFTYAHNATVLIEYCWSGSPAQTDVVNLMTPLHKCAKQPVPYDLYKL